MKAITIMFDTLNRRMLPPYGCEWVHAPNFERLAKHTVIFDNCYIGSAPCMPARRELHTGRYNFLHRSWGPLEPFDDSMPELLRTNGIYTHLISDHYHYWETGGATYHSKYNTWEFVRGQEGDPWKGQVKDPDIPENLSDRSDRFWRQDWVNRPYMADEDDHTQTRTFDEAIEFIQTNHEEEDWFLQVEAFDPHEPFFAPERFKELYAHDYDGPHFDWPNYRPVQETAAQVEHMRYEYTALLSMCDYSLGRILDLMDELGLWEDTLLIVNTDHGFLLGEHDWWAKCVQPFYNEVAHIPLFIWDPRCKKQGERRLSLVQTIDTAPTVLDFFGIKPTSDMQGRPLRDTLASDTPVREAGLFGIFGGQVNVTDGRYVYMRAPATADNQPLYNYTLMPTHMREMFGVGEFEDVELAPPFSFTKGCRTLRTKGRAWNDPHTFRTVLYDLQTDPAQEQPIQDDEIEARMIELLLKLLRESDAPPEQYERLGLYDLL
ncbi:MAG: sulfatase [Chloroflexi bacterium]|nr:sulfatase [Chloroflexota bacterium]